jgi:hypothetical protein
LVVLSELFEVHNSRSSGFEDYKQGNVRFVSNGLQNNGIRGLITPNPEDRVFDFRGICVSAFCEATVQEPPFLPRGNGGSGLIVLEPKRQMGYDELLYYAAYVNETMRWRFSFGRMVSKNRIERQDIQKFDGKISPTRTIEQLMPTMPQVPKFDVLNFATVKLTDMFRVVRGRGAYREDVGSGNTPLISATSQDNGVLDYVDLKPIFSVPAITVERVSGQAFVQLTEFVTVPADIAVLLPKDSSMSLSLANFFLVAAAINSEKWHYSYSRKLTVGRLKKMLIPMPVRQDGKVDYGSAERLIQQCYGWKEIIETFKHRAKSQIKLITDFA